MDVPDSVSSAIQLNSVSLPASSSHPVITRPKPSVTIEEIVNGTCSSCGAVGVELYKKQGILVCGKKTCYNDPTPVHQDSRRQKRKIY